MSDKIEFTICEHKKSKHIFFKYENNNFGIGIEGIDNIHILTNMIKSIFRPKKFKFVKIYNDYSGNNYNKIFSIFLEKKQIQEIINKPIDHTKKFNLIRYNCRHYSFFLLEPYLSKEEKKSYIELLL